MDKGLLPVELLTVTVLDSNAAGKGSGDCSASLTHHEVITKVVTNKTDWATAVNTNNTTRTASRGQTTDQPRKMSKGRKKSQKITRAQVLNSLSDSGRPELELPVMETDRHSISPSSTSFDSADSKSSTSTSSSHLENVPARKINRILSMIRSMQETFLQQQQQQLEHQKPKQPQYQQQNNSPKTASKDCTNEKQSEANKSGSIRRQQLQLDLNQASMSSGSSINKRLLALGRSQDSLMSARNSESLNKANHLPMTRNNSVHSFASSQCSGYTYATVMTESPPPLVHAMPYHKDGW